MIKLISFEEIFPIWKNYLWPDRTSEITANSAMTYLGRYDWYNMSTSPTFFGYYVDDVLVGVNSGHKTVNNGYRSRGLFVSDMHRGKGIGVALLTATITQAKKEDCDYCWSYPRQSSWKTYERAGFSLTSGWEKSETSDANAYCHIKV